MEQPDYLPLSYLNQLCYCPRRFWLMYCQSEMEVNAFVLDGQNRHENAHTPGQQTDERGRAYRSVFVWSDALRIAGITDFIEEKNGLLTPLEHKRGRMGKWTNDHVQLCAQALCLEERTGRTIDKGEIFYWANRRREVVPFNDDLRLRTLQTIERAFALLAAGQMPGPIDNPAKCKDCSLEPICMPAETLAMLSEERR